MVASRSFLMASVYIGSWYQLVQTLKILQNLLAVLPGIEIHCFGTFNHIFELNVANRMSTPPPLRRECHTWLNAEWYSSLPEIPSRNPG
jgi:hypothetical protein